MAGYLSLVLHAHLPYVRHPEYEEFLEEDWLYEAITETYLPLLMSFDRLSEGGVPFRLTMTMTPPLVSMLRDELLMKRYSRNLDRLVELAAKEIDRTKGQPKVAHLAQFYLGHFESLRVAFHDRYKGDLVGAFKRLQDQGGEPAPMGL